MRVDYESVTLYQKAVTKTKPFFLIHGASGLSLPFFAIPPIDRPLYGIGYPYFNDPLDSPKRRSFESLEEGAVEYIRLMKMYQPTGPYLLGGFSFGGVMAIEMARQLTERGEEVMHVVMLDSPCTTYYRTLNTEDSGWLDNLVKMTPDLDSDTREKIRQSYLQANKLLYRYDPPTYNGKVTLIKCTAREDWDRFLSPEEKKCEDDIFFDPSSGWDQCLSNLDTKPIAVVHDRMFTFDNVEKTVKLLRQAIDQYD